MDKGSVLGRGNNIGKYVEERNSRVYLSICRLFSIIGVKVTREGDEVVNISRI